MISEKYQKQLEAEKRNKEIINKILTECTKESFINFYRNHTQKETLEFYKIPNLKILRKILEQFGYDFSIPKPSKFKGKAAARSHESYLKGGQKSAETQKKSWENKTDKEKQLRSAKMKDSHSSEEFKQKIKQINIDYWNNLSKETKEQINLKKSKYKDLTPELEKEVIKFYLTPNSLNDTASKFNLHTRIIDKILTKYNILKHSKDLTDKIMHEKTEQTNLQKYGAKYYVGSKKYKDDIFNKYGTYHAPSYKFICNNHYFDSFPELYFYLYHITNNIEIKREPVELKFTLNNKVYSYYPDFQVGDKLYEIKGNQFLTEDGKWQCPFDHTKDALFEAKHQCAIKNNVIILYDKDYQKYLDWFEAHGYQKEDFLVNK